MGCYNQKRSARNEAKRSSQANKQLLPNEQALAPLLKKDRFMTQRKALHQAKRGSKR